MQLLPNYNNDYRHNNKETQQPYTKTWLTNTPMI